MPRNSYIPIITILFGLVYIPSLINTVLLNVEQTHVIDFTVIPKTNIKLLVVVIICFMESTLIKKEYPGIFGWVLSAILIMSLLIRVMQRPFNTQIIIISTVLLLGNLIYFAVLEKNKTLINYALMAYVALRISIILFRYNDLFWWLELVLGCGIITLGVLMSIKKIRALF